MKHTNFHKTSPKETREKWELVFFVCMFVTSYNFETATHASMAFWRHWRGRSIVLSFKLLSWTLRHVFGDENLEQGILSLWIGCLASCIWVLTVARILYFFCCVFRLLFFVIFYFRSVISFSARIRQMNSLVGESYPDFYLFLDLSFCVCSTNNTEDCKYMW